MSRIARNRLTGLSIALAVFGIDQAAKHWIVNGLGLHHIGDQLRLLPFFAFTRTDNNGVSLGMFEATSEETRWVLVAVTALIALGVLVWLLRERRLWDIVPLGMIAGGAAGNIRDRVLYGYVIDYADFHIGQWRPFLIFNIADAAITIGVVIILARSLFMREKPASGHSTTGPIDG